MATSAPREHIDETKSSEDDTRFLHAEVVYWWQEENLYTEWWSHSIDKYVSVMHCKVLFQIILTRWKESYDEYVGKLYKECPKYGEVNTSWKTVSVLQKDIGKRV